MNSFDLTLAGILLVSISIGLWRGAIYDMCSILGWPVAFVLSKYGAPQLLSFIPVSNESTRIVLAYALVFIAVLIVWAILIRLLSKLIKLVGLGFVDSILGGLFGALRGVLIVLALVWWAGTTHIPEQTFWRDAKFSRMAEQIAMQTKIWLPDNIAQRIKYRA